MAWLRLYSGPATLTGRASRRKGSRAELEVAGILATHGIAVRRTPNSGGLAWRGDLQGLEGYTIEVKRCERLDVPSWMRQAYAAARGGEVPVVIFRRSNEAWHVIEPLQEWARKVSLELGLEKAA